MKKSIIISVFLLGSIASWFMLTDTGGTISNSLRSFSVSDTAEIARIRLTQSDETIQLKRVKGNEWKLQEINSANSYLVRKLLYTLNKIAVKTPVGKKQSEAIVNILSTEGIRCEVFDQEDLMKAYYIGEIQNDTLGNGVYAVLIDTDTKPFTKPFLVEVPGYSGMLIMHYTASERYWRDKTVFAYDESEIKSIKIEYPSAPKMGYEITLSNTNTSIHHLSSGITVSTIDKSSIAQYLTYFSNLSFTDFDTIPLTLIKKGEPFCSISVTNKDGYINSVQFYHRTLNGKKDPVHWTAVLNGKEAVMVQVYLFGKIMQEVSYFNLLK